MKKIKFNNTDLEINYTNSLSSGAGHKKITVELYFNDEYKTFSTVTSNMPDYDETTNLEGSDKDEALFRIIEWQINDEIETWIFENKTKNLIQSLIDYSANSITSEQLLIDNNLTKTEEEVSEILLDFQNEWDETPCDDEGANKEQDKLLDGILEKYAKKLLN